MTRTPLTDAELAALLRSPSWPALSAPPRRKQETCDATRRTRRTGACLADADGDCAYCELALGIPRRRR